MPHKAYAMTLKSVKNSHFDKGKILICHGICVAFKQVFVFAPFIIMQVVPYFCEFQFINKIYKKDLLTLLKNTLLQYLREFCLSISCICYYVGCNIV